MMEILKNRLSYGDFRLISIIFSVMIVNFMGFGLFEDTFAGNDDEEIPEMFFDNKSYIPNEFIIITVRDNAENKNPSGLDSARVILHTERFTQFNTAHLEETSQNSGVFTLSFKALQYTHEKTDTLYAIYEYLEDGRQKKIQISAEIIPEKTIQTAEKLQYISSIPNQNSYLDLSSQVSVIPDKAELASGQWIEQDQTSSTCNYCISDESQNSLGKWEMRIDSKIRNLEGMSNPSQYASETLLPYISSNNEVRVLAKIVNWENNLNLIRTLGVFGGTGWGLFSN